MALKPEFIGLLRDIRDNKYPQIQTWYTSVGTIHSSIQTIETNIEVIESNIEAIEVSIHNISIGTVTTIDNLLDDTHGEATAGYNPITSKLDLGIPAGSKGGTGIQGEQGIQGLQGTQGDQYNIDIEDLFQNRSTYDGEVKAFSFLSIDEGVLYWKLSSVSGDWSTGTPFLSSEYIIQMNRKNKNLLVNADIASGTVTVNQSNFNGDLATVNEGWITYDMWKRSGTKIMQIIPKGSFKLAKNYTKTRRVYENEVLISSTRETIVSPSNVSHSWEIEFDYDNYHYDAGSYIHVQMQVEEGEYATDFEGVTYEETLAKCKEYYQKLYIGQAMPIVSSNLSKRKVAIPTILSHATGIGGQEDPVTITVTGGTVDSAECSDNFLRVSVTANTDATEAVLEFATLISEYYYS